MMCAEPDFTVLYPSDATSAWRAVWLLAEAPGPCYLRTGRPAAPILYGPDEKFEIGKCKVLRKSSHDQALIVAAGVTLAGALRAYDELAKQGIAVRVIDLFSVQPVDRDELIHSALHAGGKVIVVEDHYAHGGIGDIVLQTLEAQGTRCFKLAVDRIPHSGKPAELLYEYAIDSKQIVATVQMAIAKPQLSQS